MIEPSPRQAAGNLHRKDECLFSVRSLTPPQAARNALAIAVQIAQEIVHDESTIDQVKDASKLDFPTESFNAIFDFGIIHHIPNWKNGIEELKRVLKDGGELIPEELSLDTFSGFPGRLYHHAAGAVDFRGHCPGLYLDDERDVPGLIKNDTSGGDYYGSPR